MLSDEQRAALVDQFGHDTWDWREWEGMVDPDGEPVFIQVSVTVPKVLQIDATARGLGKTRDELLNEAIDALLATA